ncbi:MAG: type II secretion system protein [Oliverpabstia sp.]
MKMRTKKNKRGITQAELLITVAILVVLLSIGIPAVITIQRNLRQKELDAKAETIYTAVQNKMSKMKAGGNTAVFQYEESSGNGVFPLQDVPSDADSDVDNIQPGDLYYITSESLVQANSAASFIMDNETLDESLLNNHWVIEYNPKSAIVYSVFYSENRANCATGYKEDFGRYDFSLRYKQNRLDNGAKVGYYGGGASAGNSTVTTMTPTIKITNAEKLIADIKCTLPADITDYPVFKFELEDTAGNKYTKYYAYWACDAEYREKIKKEAGSAEVDYSENSMKKSGRTFSLSITLDDLSKEETRFVSVYGRKSDHDVKLLSGTPLKVTVTAMCPGNYKITQNLSDTKITNSLFADANSEDTSATGKEPALNVKYGEKESPAVINCGRHLQNLDESSGLNERSVTPGQVQYAEQNSDITFAENPNQVDVNDWYETYSGGYFNECLNDDTPNFKPINNNQLIIYNGVSDSNSYRIMNLTTKAETDAGLFEVLVDGQTLKNIILTGTTVNSTGNNTAAGALVGNVKGNAAIDHCQAYLTTSDKEGKSNHDVWISGKTAGGLIGTITKGTVGIEGSAASTVVGAYKYNSATSEVIQFGSETVGGLVGSILNDATVNMKESYADCYLVGVKAGGLVGDSNGRVSIKFCYAAGFETYEIEGAGLICGSAEMGNSYTVMYRMNLSKTDIPYYSTAKSGSSTGNVYYTAEDSNITNTPSINNVQAMGTMTISDMVSNLNTQENEAFKADTSDSTAYNLMGQSLSTYTYPALNAVAHYGDWDATFQAGSLVYYEEYSDGTYGFYGANVESTLKDDANLTVLGDGYGIVYKKSNDNLPDRVDVELFNGTQPTDDKTTLTLSEIQPYEVQGNNSDLYNIYPLSTALVNTTAASSDFYLKAKVKPSSSETADYYYFNPHFAKTVVYLTDESAPVPSLTDDSKIAVRTARHLYMMSLYYDSYANATAAATFQQERNIAYQSYEWAKYSTRTDDVKSQAPIAGNSTAFNAVYNGQGNWITDVSFKTQEGLNVGFFGDNEGTIQNVVLRASYTENGNSNYFVGRSGDIKSNQTVAMGVLVGRNESKGKISNCAVAGYYIAGSDGTIHAYENSYLYAGGLVGVNAGTVESCAADIPTMRLSSTFANAYLGGLAGNNSGVINNSYALGHIEVAFAKGGSVSIAGFAGRNSAVIRNSYCATALTSSGDVTTSYGFAPNGGSVSNCQYLNKGTYSYVNHMYSFNCDNGDGKEATYRELRVEKDSTNAAKYSYDFNNTVTNSKTYPFRAVVKDASNQLVHYGDWLDDENMGTVGIFYWELETEGSNNGYHFTYLGTADGESMAGTSLCNAHDDGGVISEYGYGYFEMNKGSVTAVQVTDAEINGKSTFDSNNDAFNVVASKALEEQMNVTLEDGTETQYTFYAFTTRTADEAIVSGDDNRNYLCMSGTSSNSTWKLTYTLNRGGTVQTETYSYIVSPFFANAMSAKGASSITSSDGTSSNYALEPGTEDNAYEIRSIEQLQFINWRTNEKRYTDTSSEQTEQYFPYECSTGIEQKYYSQTHDIKNRTESDGTSKRFYPLGRAGRSFKEQYNGNSYQIKNINIIESTSSYVGLFGELGGGTVLQNVIMTADEGKGVINSQYIADNSNNGYREPVVGALAGMVWVGDGQTNNIIITNCAASGYTVKYTGQITRNNFNRYISVGGLIGSLFSGQVENCSAANTVTVEYAGSLNYRQQLGGLIGTVGKTGNNNDTERSRIVKCYSGGKVVPDTENSSGGYLCGGLTGNANGRDKDNGMDGLAETEILDCYTYCDVYQSNTQGFNGYYYIATNIKESSRVNNTYYLQYAGHNQASNYSVGTGYDYDKMSNGTLLSDLGGDSSATGGVTRTDLGYHNVTTTEGSANVNIDGKYSYPINSALEGKNYPFPAIITQKDLTFSTATNLQYVYVHYGDWPISGPYWENGRDSMDIFQNMNFDGAYETYATKVFKLNLNGTDLGNIDETNFSVDSSIAKVLDVQEENEILSVTVQAVNTGTTTISLNETTAVFTLEITAKIQLTAEPNQLVLREEETGGLEFTAVSAGDSNKHYETSEFTEWSVMADNADILTLNQTNQTNNKNKWKVKREDMGKVNLTAKFTYDYHDTVFEEVTYVEVLQPDTVGLSNGSKYNVAYIGTEDENSIMGQDTSYSIDKPMVEDKDFFLYLDSDTIKLDEMKISSITVNGSEATKGENQEEFISEDGYHIKFDENITQDTLYQYLAGDIYNLTEGDALEPKKNVALQITLSYEGKAYVLTLTLDEVETCKELTITYEDSNEEENKHSFQREILSGKHTLPTHEEARKECADFVIPDKYMIVGWKLPDSEEVYEAGSEYNFTESVTFTAVFDKVEYTVILDANGGKISEGSVEKEQCEILVGINAVSLSPYSAATSREGYVLTGWEDENGHPYKTDAELDAVSLGGNTILFAQWEPKYTLTLINGNTDDEPYTEKIADGTKTLGSGYSEFAKKIKYEDGWTLDGWYTEMNLTSGQKVLDKNGNVVGKATGYTTILSDDTLAMQLTGNQKLYACWKRDTAKYVLTDQLKVGGKYLIVNTNTPGNGVAFGRKGTADQDNVSVTVQNNNDETYIEMNMDDRPDAVFEFTEGEKLANSYGGKTYYIQLNKNGSGVYEGHNMTNEEDKATAWEYVDSQLMSKETDENNQKGVFYYSNQWFVARSGVTDKVYIYQDMSYSFADEYKVTLMLDDSEVYDTIEANPDENGIASVTLPIATRSDEVVDGKAIKYVFDHWEDKDNNSIAAGATVTIDANTIFTAKWKKYQETTVYAEVDSFEDGKNYLITNQDCVPLVAIDNNSVGSGNGLTKTQKDVYVENGDDLFQETKTCIVDENIASGYFRTVGVENNRVTLKNGSKYLALSNNKKSLRLNDSGAIWSYSDNKLYSSSYYITYSNSEFGVTTNKSNASTIYIYEETTVWELLSTT